MSNIFEKFKKLNKITIADKAWVDDTRNQIISYINTSQHKYYSNYSEIYRTKLVSWIQVFVRPVPVLLAMGLIVLIVSNSANATVPGDALYAWKIKVNEKIQGVLALSEKSKVNYEIYKVGTRFEELAELTVKPSVSLENMVIAQENAHKQLSDTKDTLGKLDLTDQKNQVRDATIKLKATVEAQQQVIERLDKVDTEKGYKLVESTTVLVQTSKDLDEKKQILDEELIQEGVANSNSEKIAQKVTEKKKELEKTREKVESTLNGDILTDGAKNKIEVASQALNDAQDALANDNVEEALKKVQEASVSNTEAVILTDTAIRVSENVKKLLDETEKKNITSSPTPSVSATVSPSTSPLVSSSPSPSPSIPHSAALPIISVNTNKEVYKSLEPVIVKITVKNTLNTDLKLKWNNGCQVNYSIIDIFDYSKGRLCTESLTSVTIKPGESNIWEITHKGSIPTGKKTINAEVLGYGSAETQIQITE